MKKDKKEKSIFGFIENIPERYQISRRGPENEVHTKTFHLPSPCATMLRIDDELEPTRYIRLDFHGIHDSYYIGINEIKFYDSSGNILSYQNIGVDGKEQEIDEGFVPAFPPKGWWAVTGGEHSLVFDFGTLIHVKSLELKCTNAASTPKVVDVTDAKYRYRSSSDIIGTYKDTFWMQIAGKPINTMKKIEFENINPDEGKKSMSISELVNHLNECKPMDGFKNVLSKDGKSNFIFYEGGKRTRAYDLYFGKVAVDTLADANNVTTSSGVVIDDVAKRAMTLEELRVIRAVIVNNCVKDKWKSSWNKKQLRPDDVNLYDLNELLIKPLTKKRNCAFKELFSSGSSVPTYYVSHWWGESVLQFISLCEYHAMKHELSAAEAKYWVCAYANRQHDLGADLGIDPATSSFTRAMMLAKGVLLVIDPAVTAISRIWVDYEIFRTIKAKADLDVIIYSEGKAHMIAGTAIPNEAPYQKNKREMSFPFKLVWSSFANIALHKGESSVEVDKVRILNTMCERRESLDDYAILSRLELQDFKDDEYKKDMIHLAATDASLVAEFAIKACSVALGSDEHSLENFYGFNLIELISKDVNREVLKLDDLTSLDRVDDRTMFLIQRLIGPSVSDVILNVKGCKNLTDESVYQLRFSEGIKRLHLNIGSGKNISNNAIVHLASTIPKQLEYLFLDVSGFKMPSGEYLPVRYNNHLKAFAKRLPRNLEEFELITNLDDSEDGQGLLQLVKKLPGGLKRLSLVFECWRGFSGDVLPILAAYIQPSLEEFSFIVYNGNHIEDDDLKSLAQEVKKLKNLKKFNLRSRSHGEHGFYLTRSITSLQDLFAHI